MGLQHDQDFLLSSSRCLDTMFHLGHIFSQFSPTTILSTLYVSPPKPSADALTQFLAQLRLEVDSSDSVPEVRPYVLGTPFNPVSPIFLPYPITLTPRSKHAYFVPRESFNVVGIFQNPMMMLMVFTGVLVFAMPYIMVRLYLSDFFDT
jgi:hypothetical protein